MLAVYIHIPYCRTKCPYCDFVSRATDGAVPSEYVDGLLREMKGFAPVQPVGSVFLGGGTPSLLETRDLARLLSGLDRRFGFAGDVEISLEANPDDVTPPLLRGWKECGLNRLSLGVQSFDDRVLSYLGRRHDAEKARRACGAVSSVFENWSMDLMFGGKPREAWRATLEEAVGFEPAHVSAYGLTYEGDTPFGQRAEEAVGDDEYLGLYQEAERVLGDYDHYEISNYALPGRGCRHNLVYWHNEEYAGFGLGAYGFVQGVRSRNTLSLEDYLDAPGKHKEESLVLTPQEIRLETVIQYLRLRDGLALGDYQARFGRDLWEEFGSALEALEARGLIVRAGDVIRPTAQGFYLNNEIGLALVS